MNFHTRLASITLAALGLTFGSVFADSFDFSYKFTVVHQHLITGSLDGTLVGDTTSGHVTNVSVQSLFDNGDPVSGPFFNVTSIAGFYGGGSGSAVVAFDITKNNFGIFNSDYGNGDWSFTTYFSIVPSNPEAVLFSSPTISTFEEANDSWLLTDTTVHDKVPDGGATVGLLGLGLAGIFAQRRKKEF